VRTEEWRRHPGARFPAPHSSVVTPHFDLLPACAQLTPPCARPLIAPSASRIPTGFRPKAQGWRAAPTLGARREKQQPQRGCDLRTGNGPQPRWGCLFSDGCPRVARSSQPWASLRNPVGIRTEDARQKLICDPRGMAGQLRLYKPCAPGDTCRWKRREKLCGRNGAPSARQVRL